MGNITFRDENCLNVIVFIIMQGLIFAAEFSQSLQYFNNERVNNYMTSIAMIVKCE